MEEARALSNLRKKRGTAKSSVTRIGNRLRELEADPGAADAPDRAKQLLRKLDDADSDFKALHFQVLDSIDDNDDVEALEKEQDILDKHEDAVSEYILRIQNIINVTPASAAIAEAATPDHQKDWNSASMIQRSGLMP